MSLRLYCKYTGSYILPEPEWSRKKWSRSRKLIKDGFATRGKRKDRLGDQCFSTKIVLT